MIGYGHSDVGFGRLAVVINSEAAIGGSLAKLKMARLPKPTRPLVSKTSLVIAMLFSLCLGVSCAAIARADFSYAPYSTISDTSDSRDGADSVGSLCALHLGCTSVAVVETQWGIDPSASVAILHVFNANLAQSAPDIPSPPPKLR